MSGKSDATWQAEQLRMLRQLDDEAELSYERYLQALLRRDELVTLLYANGTGVPAAVLAQTLDVNRSWPKRIAESFPGRLARFRERRVGL